MSFQIDHMYKSETIFECAINVQGESYLVIFGKHINGYFCCMPDRGWGCEMAEPNDIYYNADKLQACGVESEIANAIAKAIKEAAENNCEYIE